MTHTMIDFDFGKGFVFSPGMRYVTEAQLDQYQSGQLQEPLGAYYGCDVMVYTGGAYPKVLRLHKRIPTFDSGDREYDSWHDLYLVQEPGGKLHGVYCTGGYRIAQIKGFDQVLAYPEALAQYL